ncbi:5'-AMP-activated protein kinase subunit beta-2 [Striga asiatica]|uniref:5'-AMP-activated protein kinase subunit beta-2 n=1 Tax=Striga asiatica TaxID=4170 RepID=A0A5A7PIJ5_STRAF|nr:5'-AMP-activated protein kinase subunit beta-2 [Striga asiatica]
MLSLIAANTCIPKSHHHSFSRLSGPLLVPSPIFVRNPWRKGKIYGKSVVFSYPSFRFTKSRKNRDSSWRCWCKRGGAEGGDVELEEEIMKFMAKSEKPTMFPTKKELIGGGRLDLVKAIEKRGGWYSLGWGGEDAKGHVEEPVDIDIAITEFQRRVGKFKESASWGEHSGNYFSGDDCELYSNSGDLDFLQLNASTSLEKSIEMDAEEDLGIEGILSRLERQRKNDLGFNLWKNGYDAHAGSKDGNTARIGLDGNGRLTSNENQNDISDTYGTNSTRNNEPETWRTWSNRRAGFQHTNFEAAEISLGKDSTEPDEESYHDGTFVKTEEYAEDGCSYKQLDHEQIRTHLQQLESELNTALYSLRSKRKENISEEVSGRPSDLQDLYDTWEFQENDVMSAKERLRSIRVKLAVLEGKMALAINDAQKAVEMKQKRIDGARKALRLLRNTCIVWHSSASEVFLAGSFDGWTSQRKLEKSRTGIFSICLMLYPGRHEIKFIVDGKWKVDPLRPIVKNNGYENNLLIVT